MRTTIINATADPSRVYRSERLWFIRRGESVLAVMAVAADDALADVEGNGMSRSELEGMLSGMETHEIVAATEVMRRNPLYGIQYYQIVNPRMEWMGLSRRR